MKRIFFLPLAALMILSCQERPQKEPIAVNYHSTKKVDTVDVYFGNEVPDPYRWLEDDMSEETGQWVKAQNEVTFGYLDNIPFREELKQRLEALLNYEKIGPPFKEGDYTYFRKNDGLQNQYVVYRYKTGEDPSTAEVFLDPNTFKEDGTISLSGLSFSDDGKTAAYSISEGGSDWRKILVMEVESKQIIEDTLRDIKFSGISWKANDGFFYSSYDKPDGSELSAKTDQHKLYYHKLGTPQEEDQLIYGGTEAEKHRYVQGYVTEDNRYLVVSASNATSGNKLFIKDLSDLNNDFVVILDNADSDTGVLDNDGSSLLLATNLNAPNRKIVKTDFSNPAPENWTDLIPETENVLSPSTGGGFIFAEYMIDAVSKVMQYDFEGNFVREIELPGVGSAGGFGAKREETELYYSFANYVTPGSIYKLNIPEGTSELYRKPAIDFNSDDYVSNQVFYTSKDGTRVPMIITHKKGIALDGKNPTILYGYGGFNISLTPSFSTINAVWMEQGGIYAVQ